LTGALILAVVPVALREKGRGQPVRDAVRPG
jgi:hypothetical protein